MLPRQLWIDIARAIAVSVVAGRCKLNKDKIKQWICSSLFSLLAANPVGCILISYRLVKLCSIFNPLNRNNMIYIGSVTAI